MTSLRNIKLPAFLADVEICTAPVPHELGDGATRGVLWQAEKNRFLLQVPKVARYLVEDGQRISIDPIGQQDEKIEEFLNLTPLAALTRRGPHPLAEYLLGTGTGRSAHAPTPPTSRRPYPGRHQERRIFRRLCRPRLAALWGGHFDERRGA